MATHYYETRHNYRDRRPLAADLAGHLQARQHTDKAIVLTDSPVGMLSSVRKHWLRLSRAVQRQRSSTLSADKIMRYTHLISHMQYMAFSSKPPLNDPDAHIYFIRPAHLHEIPLTCTTLYVLSNISSAVLAGILNRLPNNSLAVSYNNTIDLAAFGLYPKFQLEQQALQALKTVQNFYDRHRVPIARLANNDASAFSDALDRILDAYNEFLQLATTLQHSLDLAQPVSFSYAQKRQFELSATLAYRIHLLTSPAEYQRRNTSYLQDNTFFLHDLTIPQTTTAEDLALLVTHHQQAGRYRLAEQLQQFYGVSLL